MISKVMKRVVDEAQMITIEAVPGGGGGERERKTGQNNIERLQKFHVK